MLHTRSAVPSLCSPFSHGSHGLEAFAEGLPLDEHKAEPPPCYDMQKITDDVEMPFGAWVPSGYVSDLKLHDVTLEFCGPNSFGVMPEEKVQLENTGLWDGFIQADVPLFNAAGWMNPAESTTKAFSSE